MVQILRSISKSIESFWKINAVPYNSTCIWSSTSGRVRSTLGGNIEQLIYRSIQFLGPESTYAMSPLGNLQNE